MSVFSEADFDALSSPHVARAWFLEIELPTETARFHSGTGTKTMGGFEWRGVTDPLGGQFVSMTTVEEPRFGQAISVNITLSGANIAFFKSVHDEARAIEGVSGKLYFAVFNGETEEILIDLTLLFPGKVTSPKLSWQGVGTRSIGLTLESIWSSQNFPFGSKWTDADQQRRYPDDEGLQFVGVKVSENWK